MSNAARQAQAFYREVAISGRLWTIRDRAGFPAPLNADGGRAQPFWSSLERVVKLIEKVGSYCGFEPVEISWAVFVDRWIPGMAKDGIKIGLNWSGPRASGYDIEPEGVRRNVEAVMARAAGRSE